MALVTLPETLNAKITSLRLFSRSSSSQKSINGFEQTGSTVSQRWKIRLEFNNLKKDEVLQYRAMIAELEGRVNNLIIPVKDPRLWVDLTSDSSGFSDSASFSDLGQFENSDVTNISLSGEQGMKSVTIQLGDYQSLFKPGMYFGVDNELYICTQLTAPVGDNQTMTFQPSLRRDYSNATFRLRPVLLAKLIDDESGEHPLDMGLITAPVIELEEILL